MDHPPTIFEAFGGLGPLDALGPREYAAEELAEVARDRRALLQEPLTEIPAEVPRGYVPSGRTEGRTVPVLLAAGLAGVALGTGVALAIQWGGLWVMGVFISLGGCLQILLLGAILAYFFSPLAVAFTTGAVFAASGGVARCRSPALAERLGWGVGLLAAGATLWLVLGMASRIEGDIDPVLSGLVGTSIWAVAVGLGTALASVIVLAKSGLVYGGILAVFALLFVALAASQAGEHPFCESSGSEMERKVVGRYPLEQVGALLRGLYHGNLGMLAALESLPVDEPPDEKEARLDLTLWSGSDRSTNLVEVEAHFFEDGKRKVERRLFSEMFGREQADILSEALGRGPAEAAGDAS